VCRRVKPRQEKNIVEDKEEKKKQGAEREREREREREERGEVS